MIDTKKLEKRWIKYKFKSYLLHLIIIVSIIVVILIAFIFSGISFSKEDKQEIIIAKKTEKIDKKIVTPIKVPVKIEVITKEKKIVKNNNQTSQKKIVLEPSFSFISKIESDLKDTRERKEIYKVPLKKIIKKEPIVIPKKTLKKIDEQKVVTRRRVEETPIKIVRQRTQKDIKEVIKRFEKNHNPALSLFIARQYYKIKEYKKAYNYALITNGINNDIEESWIIFAKSLVKLHKKNIAIKMLRKYIDHSNSYRATTLLDDIYSGQFR